MPDNDTALVRTWTTAPVDYDGFGTRTLRPEAGATSGKTVRLVETPARHLDWQRNRYGSGLHLAADEARWRELVAARLATEAEAPPVAADPPGQTFLTTGQAARFLQVAPRTVSKWVDLGKLPAEREPGTNNRLIRPSDLRAFMDFYGLAIPPELQAEEATQQTAGATAGPAGD